jgi:putative colanic acid biosynthesis glycosyltransferase WcaI
MVSRTTKRGGVTGVRVVFFNRSYWPDFGATGQLLNELSQDLANEHGWEVTVVAGGASSKASFGLVSRERHAGVAILRAKGTRLARRGFAGRFVNYLSYFFSAAWASFKVGSPDVVVALTDPPIIGLVAWATARRTGARFVFLCQDIFPEVANLLEDFRSERVNAILERVNRFLVRRADRIVALGETMKNRLVEGKGASADKITVIHNWADGNLLSPAPKDNPFAREQGLVHRFVVMHAGNIGLSQNLDALVEAASELRAEDIVVLFVGDGVRRKPLEEEAARRALENVRFVPYQPRERMRESYATADVFIVSLKRGLAGYIVPSKLYGILAAGRPYIAAIEEDSEVAAITRKHECGLLVAPGDVGGLVHEISRLHRDRNLARRLGENARAASANFERRKQVRAYHDLFERQLRENRARENAAFETSL